MLDGKAATPLYVQLMEQLQDKILSGEYQQGEKLQTEGEMVKAYGVSIITVRNAIGGLIERGLVERKQGKGTFVTKPKYTRDIRKIQGFSEMCTSMGLKPGGKMLENKLLVPDDKTAEKLGQEKGSQAVFISRLRFADDEPVAIESNYFPIEYAFLLNEVFDNNSLFTCLKEHKQTAVTRSEKRIEICHATPKEAALLKVSKGAPLLYIRSVAYSSDNQPIYAGKQLINGERFSFYVCESTEL